MIYGWFYRTLMKLAHRFNWHHTRTCYPDGDTLLVCDWCGLRYVKHRRGGFMGMKITVDETMPPGTMEMRSGKHVVRVVNLWRLFRRTTRTRFTNQRRLTVLDRLTGAGQNGPATMPMRDIPMMAPQPNPMSEVQYAAQAADDALRTLEKIVHELAARLEPVLTQEPTQPATSAEKAQRPITSRMGSALYQHAQQTEDLTRVVANVLNRLAL